MSLGPQLYWMVWVRLAVVVRPDLGDGFGAVFQHAGGDNGFVQRAVDLFP